MRGENGREDGEMRVEKMGMKRGEEKIRKEGKIREEKRRWEKRME